MYICIYIYIYIYIFNGLRPLPPAPFFTGGWWLLVACWLLVIACRWLRAVDELRNGALQELKNWWTDEVRNWGIEEMRNWGIKELKNWGSEDLRTWGIEELHVRGPWLSNRRWESTQWYKRVPFVTLFWISLCVYNSRTLNPRGIARLRRPNISHTNTLSMHIMSHLHVLASKSSINTRE